MSGNFFLKGLAYALLLNLSLSVPALADMLISPTRAVMTEGDRSAVFTLRNTSDGSRTYRLAWEDKRSSPDGGLERVSKGEDWPSLNKMVRFSPRQITVGPGENQTVRLSFRPPVDLAPGEYRSHLLLKVVAEDSEPTSTMSMEHPEREGVTLEVFMQTSFSIPVIVRNKVAPPLVAIGDIDVLPASNSRSMALKIEFEKEGRSSSYGDVIVEMQRGQNGPVETIGRRKGLNIFHELERRVIEVPLRDKNIPAGSWIRIAYEGSDEYSGTLWDEKVFQSR